ncbi:MAG: E2/UBC family protein, partial [Desulfomonilia bacterium]
DTRGLPWEAVIEGNSRWILLPDYPIIEGYNLRNIDVALELSQSYPDTQIDMVYFNPHLTRLDGKSIRQLADRPIDGKIWQRWSRHRTQANPWRRGYDCIETHLLLVEEWLERELRCAA